WVAAGARGTKAVGWAAAEGGGGGRRRGEVVERPDACGAGTGVTYRAEHLKVVWEDLVTRSGATVLLHGFVQDVEVSDGRVTGLVIATKAGLQRVGCGVVVDASGDADVCHFAGFGYELAGDMAPAQTLTTTFRMTNVDVVRRRQISKDELHASMREAAESGEYDLPRREGSDHITPIGDMTATVMTRIDHGARYADGRVRNATDPEVLTRAEIEGRRQVLEYVRFLKDKVPGYEQADLVAMSTGIGLRETRRVYGDHRVTREEVL